MEPRHTRQAQCTLQFVNITGSVTLDEASRTEIRAQVMRDWHRRKKQQSFCSDSAAHGADTSSGTTRKHRFKLVTRSLLPRPPYRAEPGADLLDRIRQFVEFANSLVLYPQIRQFRLIGQFAHKLANSTIFHETGNSGDNCLWCFSQFLGGLVTFIRKYK
jgi:hypothetical protein